MANKHDYHKAQISKGTYGDDSKIYEEIDEFVDALDQGVSIMALLELSDVVGAIEGYLEKHHPSITLDDLIAMSNLRKQAFIKAEAGDTPEGE